MNNSQKSIFALNLQTQQNSNKKMAYSLHSKEKKKENEESRQKHLSLPFLELWKKLLHVLELFKN